jgi:hypothetical protein
MGKLRLLRMFFVFTSTALGVVLAASCGSEDGEVAANEYITCSTPADCPQPPDHRCGYATCEEGRCGLVISPGPIKSQILGDCRTVFCNTKGSTEEKIEIADAYDDGKECTYDKCVGGKPIQEPFPAGIRCHRDKDNPTLNGICYEGDCVGCFLGDDVLNDACDPGFFCADFDCLPIDPCVDTLSDCRSVCALCQTGYNCDIEADCKSGVCTNGKCSAPTCSDGVLNGEETGLDCGETACTTKCEDGQGCAFPVDCVSGVCWAGVCEPPACIDGIKNGEETGTDCGGPCDPCPP